jgi:hypothetical protein
MPPTIDILISPTGETTIETRGFTGPACREATKSLAAALGVKQSETLTAEYFQAATEETGLVARPAVSP